MLLYLRGLYAGLPPAGRFLAHVVVGCLVLAALVAAVESVPWWYWLAAPALFVLIMLAGMASAAVEILRDRRAERRALRLVDVHVVNVGVSRCLDGLDPQTGRRSA